MRHYWLSFFMPGIRALKRDWRSGELHLLLLALVVAVAAVTSVSFLSDRVASALDRSTAEMQGGDLVLRSGTPISDEIEAIARELGLDTSRTTSLSSMASVRDEMHLVSLKAVDDAYPLRGTLQIEDQNSSIGVPASEIPPSGTVWVDPQVLALLGVQRGQTLYIGDSEFLVEQVIAHEPDRSVQFVNVAPRAMIRVSDLEATGLIGPGSRVHHTLLVAGPSQAIQHFHEWLEPRLERGQRLQLPGEGSPEIQRSVSRAHQFLVLVALLTVVVAAVAVALAARRFNRRHVDGFAIMRCLGASQAQCANLLLVEFFLLALMAAALGTLIGYAVQSGLVYIVSALLDTSLPAPSFRPFFYGAATGLLLLAGFAWPPLATLRTVSPARVLRREIGGHLGQRSVAYLPGVLAFYLLTSWISGNWRMGLIVSVGVVVCAGAFALCGLIFIKLLRLLNRHLHGRPGVRFALSGMVRRRALTVIQICALSTGLMILLLLGITRTDLLTGWQATVPEYAANTFLINIQPDQRDAVATRLGAVGINAAPPAPMVRGRLVRINDTEIDPQSYDDERAQRLAEREFNLSYLTDLPQSNTLTQGRWLAADSNEVSLETGVAESLKIGLGDRITFDVAGAPVEVEVTSTRDVKWDSFDVNFFAVLSPQALSSAPATFITSFYLPPDKRELTQHLVQEFPNLTVFDVGAILTQVRSILDQAIQAVQLLFLFTLAAALLVLGSAFMATRDERIHEVAILRVLGARSAQLRGALYIELVLTGAVAGVLATVGALVIATLLASHVFEFPLTLSWWPWPVGVVAGALSACVAGSLALKGVLATAPLVTLREAV